MKKKEGLPVQPENEETILRSVEGKVLSPEDLAILEHLKEQRNKRLN